MEIFRLTCLGLRYSDFGFTCQKSYIFSKIPLSQFLENFGPDFFLYFIFEYFMYFPVIKNFGLRSIRILILKILFFSHPHKHRKMQMKQYNKTMFSFSPKKHAF